MIRTDGGRSFTGNELCSNYGYDNSTSGSEKYPSCLGNEFIILIKETSVASVIAITDLTQAAQYMGLGPGIYFRR